MSVIIRLQNLPWNANALDIRQFFYGLSIPDGGVHIIGGDNGDAFIAFSTDEDARRAMMNNGEKINDQPIRLFLSSKTEMQNVILAARGGPPPPTGPNSKEPFGREGFGGGGGGGASGSLGGYDFHDQRNRGGPPPGIPASMPPFGIGGEKRDGRPLGLGQSNQRFSVGPDFGGGEMRPGPDIGVRSVMDRSAGFGGRGSFDLRPSMDSKFPLSDPPGGGPLRGFGGPGDQMGGGPFQEPGGHPTSSASGNWGFPSATRDGAGNGFGDRGFLEQDRNKEFPRDVMSRDMPNRVGDGFSSPERGRLLGNQEAGRFGLGREFGRPEESRVFGREELDLEFRKFQQEQPGRPDPSFEFRRNDEFGQREPGREFNRPDIGDRRDIGRPEPSHEFGRGMTVGRVEDSFPRDDRLRPFGDDRGIGVRDFARSDGTGDFLRPNAGRDFGMPEKARDPMGGDMARDFNDRPNLRPGFPRPDGPRDFSRPEFDRSFSGPDVRSNLPRGDLGRGESISRPDYAGAGPLGFGRDEPEGARLGVRGMNAGFPRDIPPFGRNNREEGPGFGGPGVRGPNLETGPFGLPEGGPRHTPQHLGDGWRDQRERDLAGLAGRRMTPPRDMLDRFSGGGFGPIGVRDTGGYGEGAGIWVCVRNLPLSFNYREVRRFFVGCDIPPDGLKLINDRSGKRTGVAYIKFSNGHNVERALDLSGRVVENSRVMIERCSKLAYEDAFDGYKPPRGGHLEGRDRSRSPLRRRSPDREEKLCVVVKKLPARTTESEVKAFFDKAKIARNGGPFLEIVNDGQLSGCALVEFESYKDFEEAMFISKRHKLLNGVEVKVIGIKKVEFEERSRRAKLRTGSLDQQTNAASDGSRMVEKIESKDQAADNKPGTTVLNKEKVEASESTDGKPCCVELQGVPWTTNASVVKEFFRGLSIVENGIHVVLDKEGRAAGPVYVEFATSVDCKKGLEKNRQFIGKRYINVVLIGKKQMMAEVSRQQVTRPGSASNIPAGPVSGGHTTGRGAATKPGETGGGSKEVTVSLKNLNFQTQLEDILEFFRGYHPLVDSIKLQYKDGKPTGDGLATFPNTQEAESAIRLLNRKQLLGRPVLLSLWP